MIEQSNGKIKITCDREIGGKRGKDWRRCGKQAAVASERKINESVYTLHFCAAHSKFAGKRDFASSVFVTRVYSL